MEETIEQPRKIELNDGNLMPLLGLGTWKGKNLSAEVCQGAAETAIAAGYRHLDTAYSYQNEVELGKAIRSKIQQGIIRRQDMFVVSKLWCTHHAPKDIPLCLNKSLTDLQLEYLDMYLVHFPVGLQKVENELFPMKDGMMLMSDIDYVDVWKGMEALKSSGKVRSIGVSNFSIQQLERLLTVATIPPAVNQVELHPYFVQSDLIEYCKSKNIALTAYSPLGSPGRSKEYHRGDKDPEKLLEDPVVGQIAAKHRRTPSQIFDFRLDLEDMSALKSLNRGWKVCIIEE
ncbi:Estradiol 17 beta-dehydrogenase 5 [Bagarius yarrelli]|uniref:Estradiol 17 beta-dehydrogenase 5 n=1 Tax=Bagarius yarrelli TaxID=175774 RepID=A0A556TQQ8_BAGYA|nr:Estradiol 17 beta-dehydrogenase 5 [Bagarius yarrelli]